MRILYICSRETDYLQDLTFAGLKEVLGPDSVVDFPPRWQYRRRRRFPWSRKLEYPRNLGWTGGEAAPGWSLDQVQKGDFDLAVLAGAKPDALAVFLELEDRIRCPWVFVDGGDRKEVGGDFERTGGKDCFETFQSLVRRKPPAAVFKRELPLGSKPEKVFPLPFSVNGALLPGLDPRSPKRNQVVFWAVESSETRRKAFQLLAGKYDCAANGSAPGQKFRKYGLRGDAYFRALNESHIALSFRGEGFDTLRYWEVPACGTLLISERPAIRIPDDFEDGRHVVFCRNDLSDLLSLIDRYLTHPKEAAQIAAAGQKHALAHHTHLRRAEYLLDVLGSLGILRGR